MYRVKLYSPLKSPDDLAELTARVNEMEVFKSTHFKSSYEAYTEYAKLAHTKSKYKEYGLAAEYMERALAADSYRLWDRFFGVSDYWLLLLYYRNSQNYTKLGALLNSSEIYTSGIRELELVWIKYDYLSAIGQCKEAEAMLMQVYESSDSTEEVKTEAKQWIKFLYYSGCEGKNGNKVRKDKKLSSKYQ